MQMVVSQQQQQQQQQRRARAENSFDGEEVWDA
jgi:hypothetical protein